MSVKQECNKEKQREAETEEETKEGILFITSDRLYTWRYRTNILKKCSFLLWLQKSPDDLTPKSTKKSVKTKKRRKSDDWMVGDLRLICCKQGFCFSTRICDVFVQSRLKCCFVSCEFSLFNFARLDLNLWTWSCVSSFNWILDHWVFSFFDELLCSIHTLFSRDTEIYIKMILYYTVAFLLYNKFPFFLKRKNGTAATRKHVCIYTWANVTLATKN